MQLFYILLYAQMILMSTAFVITLFKFIKTKFLSIFLLCLLFLFLDLWSIFTLIGSIIGVAYLADIYLRVGILFGATGFLWIILFISSLFTSKINYYVLFLSTIIFGMFLASVAFYRAARGIWIPELNGYMLIFVSHVPRITFFLLAATTGIYALWVTIKYIMKPLKHQKNISHLSKIQITFFLFAEIITIVGSAVASYLTSYLPYYYRLIPFLILVTIGTLLILIGYLISPKIPYLVTAEPLYLYVVTDEGITIFSYNFIKRELLDPRKTIVGEIVHAIIQFGKNTLGLYKQLSTVAWGDLILTVEPNKGFTVLLVSKRYHHFLRASLKLFATYFKEKFGDELAKQKHFKKLTLFDARDLLENAFPFLTLKDES